MTRIQWRYLDPPTAQAEHCERAGTQLALPLPTVQPLPTVEVPR